MNILFFIGNGFDLNLGMKTRYSDFYKYYQSKNSENTIIKDLKKNISKKIENWSDLELALGSYTSNLKNIEELDLVIEDLGEKLSEYLKKEENSIDFNNVDREKLFNYLISPENYLLQADKIQVNNFKNKWTPNDWRLNIITFNYTNTLEKIIGDKFEKIEIGKTRHGKLININKIEHIHGYLEDRMVMGVNDISQIKNKLFQEDIDAQEIIVKPISNKAIKHTIDDWCKLEISRANLICIFGSSIGVSDNLWWELIGERLKLDCQLLIFSKSNIKLSSRIPQKNQREVRKILNKFLNKTNLSEEEKKRTNSKVFIGLNCSMFDLTNN